MSKSTDQFYIQSEVPAVAGIDLPEPFANIEQVTSDGKVIGWSWYPTEPQRRMRVEILVDDDVIGAIDATEPRADLLNHGIGDGCYGFHFLIPRSRFGHQEKSTVICRDAATGFVIGEPRLIRNKQHQTTNARILQLEQQVELLQSELENAAERQKQNSERQIAQQLFKNVGGYFLQLADGKVEADFGRQALKGVFSDLIGRYAPLELRSPIAPRVAIVIYADADVDAVYRSIQRVHSNRLDEHASVLLLDKDGFGMGGLLPSLVRNLLYRCLLPNESLTDMLLSIESEYLFLVSPDIAVSESALLRLLSCLDDTPSAGAIAPAIQTRDGLIIHNAFQFADDAYDSVERTSQRMLVPMQINEDTAGPLQVDAVIGEPLFVRRSTFELVEGFDLSYDTKAATLIAFCDSLKKLNLSVLIHAHAIAIGTQHNGSVASVNRPSSADIRRLRLSIGG
jgi:hypothetical protein